MDHGKKPSSSMVHDVNRPLLILTESEADMTSWPASWDASINGDGETDFSFGIQCCPSFIACLCIRKVPRHNKRRANEFSKTLQKFVAVGRSRGSFKKCSGWVSCRNILVCARLRSMLMQNECLAHDSVKPLARTVVLALKYDTFRKRESRRSIIKGVTYSILWQIGPLCHNHKLLHEKRTLNMSSYMPNGYFFTAFTNMQISFMTFMWTSRKTLYSVDAFHFKLATCILLSFSDMACNFIL